MILLSNLSGAKVFSSLDLRSAFHEIEFTEESCELTVFSVNFKKISVQKVTFWLLQLSGGISISNVQSFTTFVG